MKVLLLSRYGRLGASSRIRSYQFLPRLANEGIDVTVAPLLADKYLQRLYTTGRKRGVAETLRAYIRRSKEIARSHRFDLLWVEGEIFPWFPFWLEKSLTQQIPPYVVGYDDAIFHRYNLHPNPIVRRIYAGKIEQVMRRARLVIAGNDYLADYARRVGAKNVAYLPSVVDADRYQPSPKNNPAFTIGWIGTPVTAPFVNGIAPALIEASRGGSTKLLLVGAGEAASETLPAEVRRWSEASEITDIQSFDVGIMPLPDEPFERGKCGYKLIQYMACGLPVIASPVGVNTRIVEDGVNGFLATTQEEWVRAIRTLKENPELRSRMGAAGRKKVEREYSVAVAAVALASLLRSAADCSAMDEQAVAAVGD